MQGEHLPADEHGLAWSPREWHLTPDTMALARFDAPAEPSNGCLLYTSDAADE